MEFLRTNKTTKDKIPEGYEKNVQQVLQLFQRQTVYNLGKKALQQLQPITSEDKHIELDMKYIGSHDRFENILADHTSGRLCRFSGGDRKEYRGQTAIDMSKVRMDFARNEVTERSFIILDEQFFKENTQPDPEQVEEKKE